MTLVEAVAIMLAWGGAAVVLLIVGGMLYVALRDRHEDRRPGYLFDRERERLP